MMVNVQIHPPAALPQDRRPVVATELDMEDITDGPGKEVANRKVATHTGNRTTIIQPTTSQQIIAKLTSIGLRNK